MSRIINKLKRIKTEIKWKSDAYTYKKKIQRHDICEEIINNNIWILMPHSDDEWIGCSQLLCNKSDSINVINMNMTGGDNETLHKERNRELLEMAEKFGYRVTLVDDFNYLSSLLIKEVPEIVFLPSFLDWHDEHHLVIDNFEKAAKNAGFSGEIGMYQISVPLPVEYINAGYSMSKEEIKNKWYLFGEVYKSQKFLPQKRFLLNEIINGAVSDSFAMEAYSILSFEEWLRLKKKYSLNDMEIDKIKANINDIGVIRKIIEKKVKC